MLSAWAGLWRRDPRLTGGRWDGGWGRLGHGDALATALGSGEVAAVFIFCSKLLRGFGQDRKGYERRSNVLNDAISTCISACYKMTDGCWRIRLSPISRHPSLN